MKKTIIIGLLTFGVISVYATLSSFSKEWYEDCSSEQMKKGYISGFKNLLMSELGGNTSITYVKINSEPEELSNKKYLTCKINLSFRASQGMNYLVGTSDLISTVKSFDEATQKADITWMSSNVKSRRGNMMTDAIRDIQ